MTNGLRTRLRSWNVLLAIASMMFAGTAAASDTLPARIDGALDARSLPADTLSIHVVDLESGEPVLDWNAGVARNPASTMKIVTLCSPPLCSRR